MRARQLLEQQLVPPQQEPSASETLRRFFSSGTGWRVVGAEAGVDEVVMASMLLVGDPAGAERSLD